MRRAAFALVLSRLIHLCAASTPPPPPALPVLAWVARSDWASVTAFGAKGDGTTDDTRAIQAGLDFVQASGIGDSANKTLFFPAGTYLVTTTLLLNYTNGVLLLGTGATTVLLWGGGSAPAPPPDGGVNRLLWSNVRLQQPPRARARAQTSAMCCHLRARVAWT
jgi:hypothetical protein